MAWAEAIVEATTDTVEHLLMKIIALKTLLSDGDIAIAVTSELVGDCDRLLVTSDDEGRVAAEPKLTGWRDDAHTLMKKLDSLWSGMRPGEGDLLGGDRRSTQFGVAASDLFALTETVAVYDAQTRAGLRLKGELFQDVIAVFGCADGLVMLQLSYLDDARSLVWRRLQPSERTAKGA